MTYIVDGRQTGIGFNWDRSSNRVLGKIHQTLVLGYRGKCIKFWY